MSKLIANGAHSTWHATHTKDLRTRAVNSCPQCGGPITNALAKFLVEKVPNDLHRRTYAEVIAEVLIRKAAGGDMQTISEIADRVEGKVSEARHHELDKPVQIRVVYENPIPEIQKRDINSAQPQSEHS